MATKLVQLITDSHNHLIDTSYYLEALPQEFWIDNARGIWLDAINTRIGGIYRPRKQDNSPIYNDVELRKRMRVKAKLNTGCGTVDSAVTAVQYYVMTNDSMSIDLALLTTIDVEIRSAFLWLFMDVGVVNSKDKLREIVNFIPSGVGLYVVEVYGEDTFAVSDTDVAGQIDLLKGIDHGRISNIIQVN